MNTDELRIHINSKIQAGISGLDMEVIKEEVEKLEPGQIYLEVGVDEGSSMRTAWEYAKEGVYVIGVDIHDTQPTPPYTVGRGPFAESEGMVGVGKNGFFVHGDGDIFAQFFGQKIDVMFLDPHHDYESIKSCTLAWEPLMKKGGVILFHDYDHEDTKRFLDEHYGDKKEILHGKVVRVRL